VKRSKEGSCFICTLVARSNPHHTIYENETAIAFLRKYPVLYGLTLVATRDHREQVTEDFTLEEYLALQQRIYQVAEAIRQLVPTARLSILTHWAASKAIDMRTGISCPGLRAYPTNNSRPLLLASPERSGPFQATTGHCLLVLCARCWKDPVLPQRLCPQIDSVRPKPETRSLLCHVSL
jgi:hypothetical protein